MSNEEGKRIRPEEAADEASEPQDSGKQAASRARNKTVMLTPDVAQQVRAQLHGGESRPGVDPVAELLPPGGWDPAKRSTPTREPAQPASRDSRFNAPTVGAPERRDASASGTGFFTPGASGGPATRGRPTEQHSAPTSAAPMAPMSRGMEPRQPAPTKRAKIVGFLISFDRSEFGEVSEIRAGRWLLTSRPADHGDQIVIDDESISPLHAIVRATADGKIQVLDQLSEFGTGVTRHGSSTEEEISGSMSNLEHGDTVRFGKRKFIVCIVPQ